ncbi:hypothetical protein [Dapis sp. BLCC M172]
MKHSASEVHGKFLTIADGEIADSFSEALARKVRWEISDYSL